MMTFISFFHGPDGDRDGCQLGGSGTVKKPHKWTHLGSDNSPLQTVHKDLTLHTSHLHRYTRVTYRRIVETQEHGHDDDVAGVYDGHDDGADDGITG